MANRDLHDDPDARLRALPQVDRLTAAAEIDYLAEHARTAADRDLILSIAAGGRRGNLGTWAVRVGLTSREPSPARQRNKAERARLLRLLAVEAGCAGAAASSQGFVLRAALDAYQRDRFEADLAAALPPQAGRAGVCFALLEGEMEGRWTLPGPSGVSRIIAEPQ